ncbi:archease [Chloroflexota bacterium]
MNLINDLRRAQPSRETVLTVGVFDGVHLGHQALVGTVVKRAEATDRLAAVVTFHPHPAEVVAPERGIQYLTAPAEKVALLEGLGVDLIALLRFDQQLATMSAHDFVAALVKHLRAWEIWIGPDFTLGRSREGNAAYLQELGQALGFELRVVEPAFVQPAQVESLEPLEGIGTGVGGEVSSSHIRRMIREGRVSDAAQLLGRDYSLAGTAMPATEASTVILEVGRERAMPATGVYAVVVGLETDRYAGVASAKPGSSSNEVERTLKVQVLGADRDLGGCHLIVEFVERLRDYRHFESNADLSEQIRHDRVQVRGLVGTQVILGPELARRQSRSNHAVSIYPFRYREIEHTADRALWVWGEQLADLYAGAARGMYTLMADIEGRVATRWREIRLKGRDREGLLVDWLNELLFVSEVEHVLFVDFQVTQLGSGQLVALAGEVPGSATQADIKAATFHNLAVNRVDDGWSTVITFDV